MRLGLLLGGVLLVAPGLVSCGGDDGDEPGGDKSGDGDKVSVEEFCSAAEKFENTFTETDTTNLPEGVGALKDAAQELKDVGTPEDIPDDAREGLELTLDKLIALPDDADQTDLMEMLDLDEDERAKSMAFEDYLDGTCQYRDGTGG
jgi:hypothetical protein